MRRLYISLTFLTAVCLFTPALVGAQEADATPEKADTAGKKPKAVVKKPVAAPEMTVQRFGGWQVSCPKADKGKEKCAAQFVISDKKRKIAILTWSFGYNQKSEMLSEIVSPVDVYIAPGASVAIDGTAAIKQPYVLCGAGGCLSRAVVTKAFLTSLKASKKASITITSSAGKDITFGMGTDGLGDALKALGQ